MHRRLLKGDALAKFNTAAAARGNETVQNLVIVLNDVTTHVFPDKALTKQRLYMNRYLRKPLQTKMRQYMARINEINNYLPSFPPFGENQKFSKEDLKEQLYANLLSVFTTPMRKVKHDILTESIDATVKFCKSINCLLYTSPSPRDLSTSRMPSSA